MSVDPLAEDYANISPYAYVANNPLIYIDPDGRSLVLGFQDEKTRDIYQNIVNNMFEGQFQLTFDKMDNGRYKVNVVATPNGGGDLSMLSEGGQKFYKAFTGVTTDENATANFDVVTDSDNVDIGNYKFNVMDIGDVQAFPVFDNCSVDQCGPTQAGKIIHETTEQHEKAKLGVPKGSRDGFDNSHSIAIDHEDDTNQNYRGNDSGYRHFATQRFTSKRTGKTTKWEITLGRNGRKTRVDPPK